MYLIIALAVLFICLQPFENELMFTPEHPLTWLTGHFVHLSYTHIIMNLFGLVVFLLVKENKLNYTKTTIQILISAFIISFGLYVQNYGWYVGFSGILHALFVIAFWEERKNWFGKMGLAVIFGKIVVENTYHSQYYEHFLGGHIATPAHIYGALAGLVLALGFDYLPKFKVSNWTEHLLSYLGSLKKA